MKNYNENSYVACSNGKADCYLIEQVHDNATQVMSRTFSNRLMTRQYLVKTKTELDERRRLSLAVVTTTRIWDSGVICYQLNVEYPFNGTEMTIIYTAMRVFEEHTNVRFKDHSYEIGHSLGMYHEHQHYMRTIGIFWAEMSIRDVSVGDPYDQESFMHYPMTYGLCLFPILIVSPSARRSAT